MAEQRKKHGASAVEGEEQQDVVAEVEPAAEEPAVESVPDVAPAADPPRTYTAERLTGDAEDFLGVPSHVAAGAFYGQKSDNWTIDEAVSRVNAWLKMEV